MIYRNDTVYFFLSYLRMTNKSKQLLQTVFDCRGASAKDNLIIHQ